MTQQENHANADKLSIQKIIFFVNDSVSIRQEATFCVERWRERNVFCTERESFGFSGKCFTGRRCSLLTDKREPERTAVPGGHESPSGAFKPQTGLRSKCRVFSAARSQRFRRAAAGRGLFSFGTKREPEKCQRFRRAGPTRKGLLAPFNPKEDGLYTKKLAASLNAFCVPPFQGPSAAAAAAPRGGAGCALSVTFGDTLSPFCRCATSSPDRGKSFKGRGKKRSLHGLGSPFGRAGAKRLRGFVLPQAATDAK